MSTSIPLQGVPDAHTILMIEDDIYEANSFFYPQAQLPYSTGTPVIFRSWWPPVGCIAGYNAIGAIAPVFLLPTPASQVPYGIYSEPSEAANSVWIRIEGFVADDDSSPSVAMIWDNTGSETWNLPITVWVEYEEGNALEHLGHSQGIVPSRGNSSDVDAIWTPGTQYVDPTNLYLGTTQPLGPLTVSVGMVGYTTDTIHLNIESTRVYHWRARFAQNRSHPNPSPSASEILDRHYGVTLPPPPIILERANAWLLLGLCDRSSNIQPYMNGNEDGVADVADLIVSQGGSSGRSVEEKQP